MRNTKSPRIRIGTTSATSTTAPNPNIMNPVSLTVAANFGPEDIPTCARKSVRPRLRRTMLAESGMAQLMPRVRRILPRMSAMISTPDNPTEILPMPGSGIWIADQEAKCHTDADADVAELGCGLDRIAEEFAHRREIV